MKKVFSFLFTFFFCTIVFAQSEEIFTDAMSSQWVTVGNVAAVPVSAKAVAAKKTAVRTRKPAPAPKPAASTKSGEAFNKTNTQVKRFKKTSG